MIKEGTRWWAGEGKKFIILALVEEDKNIWVHYRNQQGEEFSCFEEAFVLRFREDANDKR